MNKVELIVNPYTGKNTLSPHSIVDRFSQWKAEPFLSWCSELFKSLSESINDEYELSVQSADFEFLMLESLSAKDEDCHKINRINYEIDYSVSKRFEDALSLKKKYLDGMPVSVSKIKYYSEFVGVEFSDEFYEKVDTPDDALILLLNTRNNIPRHKCIAFVLSDTSSIDCLGREIFLWRDSLERVQTVIHAIAERFYQIEYVNEIVRQLGNYDHEDEAKVLQLNSANSVLKTIDYINTVVGNSVKVKISSYFESSVIPELDFECSNPSVCDITFDVNNSEVLFSAKAQGTTEIKILRKDDGQLVATTRVSTLNVANEIKMDIGDTNKKHIGDKIIINCHVFPEDAIDAEELQIFLLPYEFTKDMAPALLEIFDGKEPDEIVKRGADGCFYAVQSGVFYVVARIKDVVASKVIMVLPNKLSVMTGECELSVNSILKLTVDKNLDISKIKWSSSNENVVKVINNRKNHPILRGNRTGECVVYGHDIRDESLIVELNVNVKREPILFELINALALFFVLGAIFFALLHLKMGVIISSVLALILSILTLIFAGKNHVYDKRSIYSFIVLSVLLCMLGICFF